MITEQVLEVFIAPNIEPLSNETSRYYHYHQVGINVTAHSYALIALWTPNPKIAVRQRS